MNKVILCGNLGQDPAVRDGKDKSAVCSFSVATHDSGKGGEKKTTWHKVVAFGALAESCGEYLRKGDGALIEGRIDISSYKDKEGKEKESFQVVALSVQFLQKAEKEEEPRQGGRR